MSALKKISIERFKEDNWSVSKALLGLDFYSMLPLSTNGQVYFSWADSALSVNFYQKDIRNLGHKYHEFKKLMEHINELRESPVWIIGEAQMIQSNLHDLYHAYILPHKSAHTKFGLDLKNVDKKIKISLVGPSGPFIHVNLCTWINEMDHLNIIYKNILSNHLTPRDFRLRTEGKILVEYAPQESCIFHVKQMTKDGLLLYTREQCAYGKINSSENITLQMNLELMKKASQYDLDYMIKTLGESPMSLFFSHKKEHRLLFPANEIKSYLTLKNADGKAEQVHYLFVPYKAFAINHADEAQSFLHFMNFVCDLMTKKL